MRGMRVYGRARVWGGGVRVRVRVGAWVYADVFSMMSCNVFCDASQPTYIIYWISSPAGGGPWVGGVGVRGENLEIGSKGSILQKRKKGPCRDTGTCRAVFKNHMSISQP